MTLRRPVLLLLSLLPLLGAQVSAQQIALEGLRAVHGQGAFHGLRSDASGNLYTLFDAHDGVHLLEFDPAGTHLLQSADLGGAGDTGVALDLDPAGNVYVAGTSTSQGTVAGTGGTAFPTRADSSTNSFVAKFTPSLGLQWISFCGSGRMAVSAIAATGDAVLLTGSIFAATLPVTDAAIQQTPAPGSFGNGFVERFTGTGTLSYATYLSGGNGETTPAAIATSADGSAFIAGTTTASGFPTANALVPTLLSDGENPVSGFVTRLTPAGDGFAFSTFVPGSGLSSLAFDPSSNTVLISGNIASGLFPIDHVGTVVAADLSYQSVARIAGDGSAMMGATMLSPGSRSVVAAAANGFAWVAVTSPDVPVPVLPAALALPEIGDALLYRLSPAGQVDRALRLGGQAATNGAFASMPTTLSGLVVTASSAMVAGSVAPTLSSDLLSTERFDLPLIHAPSAALPSTLRDALPSAGCSGSLCSGSAALLTEAAADASSPALTLALDEAPRLLLRNASSVSADNLNLSADGLTITTDCRSQLAADEECSLLLTSSGPGSVSISAAGAATQTFSLPANRGSHAGEAVSVTPRALRFSIVTAASSAPATATLTLSNLGSTVQTVVSQLSGTASSSYSITERASDCTLATDSISKVLAPGSVCHVTLGLAAAGHLTAGVPVLARWRVGPGDVALSGYVQSSALSLSATRVDFGRQYAGGMQVPRFLFLSNSSDTPQPHTPAAVSPLTHFSLTDECPATLEPHTVCRMDIGYNDPLAPSSDSTTLIIDSIPVLLQGETMPKPTVVGASANPNLQISSATIAFANAVVVTGVSSETQTVIVTNAGAQSFALTLTLSGDFLENTDCPSFLAGGASCNVVLSFAPSAPGARSGLLGVSANGGAPVYATLTALASGSLAGNDGTLSFGAVVLGTPTVQWVKVSQPFSHLAVTSSSPDFGTVLVEDAGYGHGSPPSGAFSSVTSGSCLNCYIGVQFTPSSVGAQSASLLISSGPPGNGQSVDLSGTGVTVAGLTLTPSTAHFGPVPVNSSTAPTAFTLTNATGSDVTLTAPTVTGDFRLSPESTDGNACPATLLNNASCQLAVQFYPSSTGARLGTLSVSTSAGDTAALLSGFGTADPGIAFNPGELRFRNVPGSASQQGRTTVTNTGNVPAVIGAVTVSDARFAVLSSCSTLPPSATCTVDVTYTPTDSEVDAVLTLPVTTGFGEATTTAAFSLPLRGLYTAQNAGLEIVPGGFGSVEYGSAPTGSSAQTRLLHVSNLTSHPLAITVDAPRQFPITGSDCSTLPALASCDVAVAFAPLLNGDATGTVLVQGAPTDGSAPLSGLGYLQGFGSATSTLQISGPLPPVGPLDFGEVASGQVVLRTLTLTNPASAGVAAPMTVRRIRSDFPFRSTTDCGQPLDGGESCHITVGYAPLSQVAQSTAEPGTEADSGVLTIESDAANAPLFVDLAGRAIPAVVSAPSYTVPVSAISTSTGALFFANADAGTVSSPQTILVTNTGTAVIHIFGVMASPGFNATSACGALLAGVACSVDVTFAPHVAGGASGALEIQSDSAASLEYVSLLASANAAGVSLQPQRVDFGSALIGSTRRVSAVLTNSGKTPVTYTSATASGDFSVGASNGSTGACAGQGATLPPGRSCSIALEFVPTAAGSRRGTLLVKTSGTALPLSVDLAGIGLQPQLSTVPSAITFGNVAVGSSASLSFTLANTSTTSVTGITVETSGMDFRLGNSCGVTTLAAGSSCSATVVFQPTAAGARTGIISITSSDAASPLLLPVSGGATVATAADGGSFLLAVNGGSSASASARSGTPATFALLITPLRGFSGTVALTCTPATQASYLFCSLLPSTMLVSNGPQTSVVTVTTISAIAEARPSQERISTVKPLALCLALPGGLLLFLRRRRGIAMLLLLAFSAALFNGCGGSASPIRYAAPGTYRFTVSASATTGAPVTQNVTVEVTVLQR